MTVTDDYLLGRAKLAGTGAAVLDLGCGDGRFVEVLVDSGFNAQGVDVQEARLWVAERLARRPDLRPKILFLDDEEKFPLPDASVDVVVANNVFEHIPTLDSTVREMARVLKPDGFAYIVFPLKSSIIEGHALLPFFHRIKNRRLRLGYAKFMKAIGLYGCPMPPKDIENYVAVHCFYRSRKEVEAIFSKSFGVIASDVCAYIGVKAESLAAGKGLRGLLGRFLLHGGTALLAPMVHSGHAAAYKLSKPVRRS